MRILMRVIFGLLSLVSITNASAAPIKIDLSATTSSTPTAGIAVMDFIDGDGVSGSSVVIRELSVLPSIIDGSVTQVNQGEYLFTDNQVISSLFFDLTDVYAGFNFIIDSSLVDPGIQGFPDALTLSILNLNGTPLFTTADPRGADSLLVLSANTKEVYAPSGFTISLTSPNSVPEPNTLLLLIIGTIGYYVTRQMRLLIALLAFLGLASTTTQANPTDVTAQVSIVSAPLVYNRTTQTFDGLVTVRNVGSSTLQPSVFLVVSGLPNSVSVYNATNFSPEGKPMLSLPVTASGLAPGQAIKNFGIKFRNPGNLRFTPSFNLLSENSVPRASTLISSDGGEVSLSNYASIIFPKGSFSTTQLVELSVTRSPETASDFEVSKVMFDASVRTSYELRLNSGTVRPQTDFEAVINVPADFLAQVPVGSEIQVFAQIFQDGGDEVLDQFELFDSTYSSVNNTVTVTLPPEAFTNRRNTNQTYEAIILLATTPTKPTIAPINFLQNRTLTIAVEEPQPLPPDAIIEPPSIRALTRLSKAAATACQGSSLSSPIENGEVTSPYNGKNHYGTDYRAADGTSVRSMADGVIEKIGFDERPLQVPDPRSGKMVKGWGRYVVVKHSDGSRSLYAHLQKNSVQKKVNDTITQGDTVGLSDNSGGSSGPHLHVEYAPNGKIYDKKSKVDPEPCIDENVTGSVTVNDNGSLADDAFTVAINSLIVCKTAIGASNTCAVGNLRPGSATLAVTAVIAPDNVGTYEISLADGLTFSNGTTYRTGTIPQGGTASFSITIP
ncbi:M23 family metallopeptidase [Methylomonas rapida]|uniref:M23 family metallopeptidase n=1 Tax=Methylomonas rapida TaxID=2963939 RepID=A0ABY7GQQ6_9GAMM|nr:M23 family metallopeptidase [Methylomonas rapida]WAR46830.1 M23 family metallopeptidase [Methylomonas rapida]